jgi:radical SAM superfamily enzyme YgiQ (UPF0313 family)
MRVCLASPLTIGLSPEDARTMPYGDAPLGILTLAAVARNCGHPVQIFDLDHLSHMTIPSRFLAETADRIAATGRDVYGFGTICHSYPLTLRLVREVRRRCPNARIVLGGPQASVTDREVLQAVLEVDVVVRGEAERTLPALLKAFETRCDLAFVPGVTYRNVNGLCRTGDAPIITDLDEVPDPAWDLDEILRERPDASVELGRGCPFACEFCSTNDFFRRKFRMKSPRRVLGQMAEIERRYGFRKFSLVHDMFTVDRRRVAEFCDEAARFGRDYEWGCSARTDFVDYALLERMHRGGCRRIFFGVESGSARLQRSMNKDLDLDQARDAIRSTQALGMHTTVSLIIGFPDETQIDLQETAEMFMFASRFDVTSVHLHLLNALAGTPITSRYRESLRLDVAPEGLAGDPEDLEWIRAHVGLFVNFYSLPTQLPRHYLRELKDFIYCGTLRCNWLMQALHIEGENICEVFRKFHDPSQPRSSKWYRSPAFRKELIQFSSSLANKDRRFRTTRVMVDLYRQLECASVGEAAAPDVEFSYDCLPTLPDGASVVCCRGDVLKAIQALRAGDVLPESDRSPRWIVLHTSEDQPREIKEISSLAGKVLSWCDGRRNARLIGRRAKRSGLAPSMLDDGAVAEVLLRRLHAEGLIRFEIGELEREVGRQAARTAERPN